MSSQGLTDDQMSVDTPTRKSRRIAARQQQDVENHSDGEGTGQKPPASTKRSTRKRKTDEESVTSSKASRTPKRSRARKSTEKLTDDKAEETVGSKLPTEIFVGEDPVSSIHVKDKEPAARSIPVAIDNLRIPASHTPGKPSNATERLRPLPEEDSLTTGVNVEIQAPKVTGLQLNFGGMQDQHEANPLAQRSEATDSGLDALLAISEHDASSRVIVQQQKEAVAFQARHTRTASRNIDLQTTFTSFEEVFVTETQVLDADSVQKQNFKSEDESLKDIHPSLLRRVHKYIPFWFTLLAMLTIACAPYLANPVMKSMTSLADLVMHHCQEAISRWNPPIAGEDEVQKFFKEFERILSVQHSVKTAQEELVTLTEQTDELNKALRQALAEQQKRLKQSIEVVFKARAQLEQFSSQTDSKLSTEQIVALKEQLQGCDGIERSIVDVSFLDTWVFPDSSMVCNESIAASPEVDMKALEKIAELLKEEAAISVENLMSSDFARSIRGWILEDLAEQLQIFEQDDGGQVVEPREQQSLEVLAEWIKERLELERADQTGKFDLASIVNGAKVIRHGRWATSPSLKDELPLLNRMADVLGLRFYGYGPEAALTPVEVSNPLGRCWSFRQHRGALSDFGIISFGLARHSQVQRIEIEHPPKEVSDRVKTAIRSFRLLGFEDAAAQSEPWALGSFEYAITGSIRQSFDVPDYIGDRTVPPLSAVAVAIDSNWGGEYACLYRVRVYSS